MIKDITKNLAAGFLLLDDYGPTQIADTSNGQKKVDDARALLARIKSKELVLADVLGSSTALSTSDSLTMWPDATTADADPADGGGPRMFRVSDISGNGGRY
jgi:aminoglycoside/choline kinase family phosphotransferase